MFFSVPEDGKKHQIRVLPGTFGKSGKKWFVTSAQHWASKRPHECPRKAKDEYCPFCALVDELRDQEKSIKEKMKKADEVKAAKLERQQKKISKMIMNLLAKPRFLVNIVDRSEATPVVRVFRAPKSVFDAILNTWEAQEDDILDENSGHDFILTREKKQGRTSYSATPALQKTALASTVEGIEKLLDKRPDLEKMIKLSSPEDLQTACNETLGVLQKEAAEETEAEAAPETRKKPSVDFGDDDDDTKESDKAAAEKAKLAAAKAEARSETREFAEEPEAPITPVADPKPEAAAPASKGTADLKSQLAGILGDDED